ncbi:hypothetical protein GMDG_04130 [Pseudogymnoascus destructans 20631-21]|uniref:Uncharacterized protein n=1 Tax=Pseudogymnoascus destructans (strain ATCC MYA-4855 / 20631-21) TaxID=658429 RepID=L8G9W1_PSED2|nr:hypothetical protein GMDG_04130 [Pseudogymnoascus destructans 20631-21]
MVGMPLHRVGLDSTPSNPRPPEYLPPSTEVHGSSHPQCLMAGIRHHTEYSTTYKVQYTVEVDGPGMLGAKPSSVRFAPTDACALRVQHTSPKGKARAAMGERGSAAVSAPKECDMHPRRSV